MTKFTELKIENFLENEEDIKGFLQETGQLNNGSPEDFKATLHALKIVARAMSRIDLANSSEAEEFAALKIFQVKTEELKPNALKSLKTAKAEMEAGNLTLFAFSKD